MISVGCFYAPYIPLLKSITLIPLPPPGKRMTDSKEFLTQIIDECNTIIESESEINLVFGNLLYNTNSKFHKLKVIEFRNRSLSLLVSDDRITCILHHDGTVMALNESEEVDIQQRLNKIFAKIEDCYNTSIEDFTNGNFQYFDV